MPHRVPDAEWPRLGEPDPSCRYKGESHAADLAGRFGSEWEVMNERPARTREVRRAAYLLLAVVAAVVTPSPDAITMAGFFLAGVALFELGFFAYRRRGGGR